MFYIFNFFFFIKDLSTSQVQLSKEPHLACEPLVPEPFPMRKNFNWKKPPGEPAAFRALKLTHLLLILRADLELLQEILHQKKKTEQVLHSQGSSPVTIKCGDDN